MYPYPAVDWERNRFFSPLSPQATRPKLLGCRFAIGAEVWAADSFPPCPAPLLIRAPQRTWSLYRLTPTKHSFLGRPAQAFICTPRVINHDIISSLLLLYLRTQRYQYRRGAPASFVHVPRLAQQLTPCALQVQLPHDQSHRLGGLRLTQSGHQTCDFIIANRGLRCCSAPAPTPLCRTPKLFVKGEIPSSSKYRFSSILEAALSNTNTVLSLFEEPAAGRAAGETDQHMN